jgi:hypothetical protein
MSDTCIYSLSFINKIKDLNISKSCPENISKLDIKFEKVDHIILPVRQKFSKFKKNTKQNESAWKNSLKLLPLDVKKITSILNKLTEENYTLMLNETKTFNYSNPEIVTKIFKKVLAEPFFSKIYSKFCKDLENLHPLLKDMYIKEFKENKHKNLAIFIGELYNIELIDDLSEFLYELESNLTEKNIEILCTLIKTVGIHNVEFYDTINKLNRLKDTLSSRFRFMILDIIELL